MQNGSQALVETIAGLTAGAATTLVVHPLDLIKTRLQIDRASTSDSRGSVRIARDVFRNEGGYRGLYRGIAPNLIGNSVSWALYFLWYGQVKSLLAAYHGEHKELSYYDYFLASGSLTAICTNPIWVIKTRMLSTSSTHENAYSSILDGTRRIFRTEGLRGFYRGLVPSLFGVSHGALQFMAYEKMKHYGTISSSSSGRLNNLDFLLFSGLSKMFAGTATYPYQVVRARLQTYDADRSYRNATDVVRQVWRSEGLKGFYKGLGPNLLRVVPSSCVTFLVYENTKRVLPGLLGAVTQKIEK
ncbi:hypothetical protein MMC25_006450 [Agyrium rufum]|nr:hypothetical protein [Agyrium rufum]